MVSTRSLIHWRAASSILALSTRSNCVAERTVICWCSIKLRVTGAAQIGRPSALQTGRFAMKLDLGTIATGALLLAIVGLPGGAQEGQRKIRPFDRLRVRKKQVQVDKTASAG
ncbi:MAG: hypothetical protein NVSMB31_02410 [Vulcanimicrobiaceae bacterium]